MSDILFSPGIPTLDYFRSGERTSPLVINRATSTGYYVDPVTGAITAMGGGGGGGMTNPMTTIGDIIIGAAAGAPARLAATTNGFVLTLVGGSPAWAAAGGGGITALTGDVTASGSGSVAATIGAGKVTYAKFQNSAAGEVVLTRANTAAGSYGETALAASQLLGRGSTGDIAAITLGSTLAMSGTTLGAAFGTLVSITNGTFTPVAFGTTIPGTGTYTVQVGQWWQLNFSSGANLLYINVSLSWTAHTGTGGIRISGIPAAAKAGNNGNSMMPVYADSLVSGIPKAVIVGGDNFLRMITYASGGSGVIPFTGNTVVTNLFINGFYPI